MEKQTQVDAELEKLKDKYPFKDWQDHARITEKWRNAGWEIQKVWELYDKEEITQSRARELTRYITDSYATLPNEPPEITRLQNIGIAMANDIEKKRKEIESLKQQLNKDCTCTPDQTTGHTGGKCNVCGKDIEEAAIQHADSLHKKGSSELAGNGKLTENDCWENAYFNFKEGSKVKKVEVKWEDNMK